MVQVQGCPNAKPLVPQSPRHGLFTAETTRTTQGHSRTTNKKCKLSKTLNPKPKQPKHDQIYKASEGKVLPLDIFVFQRTPSRSPPQPETRFRVYLNPERTYLFQDSYIYICVCIYIYKETRIRNPRKVGSLGSRWGFTKPRGPLM